MRLEDLTGDDRTLVVVALQALYRERANSYNSAFLACQLAGKKPPDETFFWRGGKYFGNSQGWRSSAEMKPDMKSAYQNDNRRTLLTRAGQLLVGVLIC